MKQLIIIQFYQELFMMDYSLHIKNNYCQRCKPFEQTNENTLLR